jgi:flavin reductase (DIM6/NTAB) family NADH-FMN oxidoreductase RutF
MDPCDATQFREAMRRLAAGVTIVTTEHEGEKGGLTATAVCSLSTEPPQILVCVNRTARAHDLIHKGDRMCVNVLAHGQQELAARFAGQNGISGPDRFLAGQWIADKTGAPVLEDALASFECVVAERVSASTHTIFIGKVVAVRGRTTGRPLLYASGSYAGIRALVDRALRKAAPVKAPAKTKIVRRSRARAGKR